ncbi:MAG: 3-deoxy-7-phosphoheptulonate synthase, partial [Clostridiales bacterium]|nr:3-deoxy-7-phosphoheptulonate synthase [Clostridiales bacterium]
MIIVLKPGITREQVDQFSADLESRNGVKVNAWYGEHSTVLGLLGDTAAVDMESLQAQDMVESVKRVQEPYKKTNRKFHPDDTVIDLGGGSVIGGGHLAIIAGPCSVENEEQIAGIAADVKEAGAVFLRGGAFKPRTSPYAFQGLRASGLELLRHARQKTGLPIVTEIMSPAHLVLFEDVDVIQVGARNMQNFELL